MESIQDIIQRAMSKPLTPSDLQASIQSKDDDKFSGNSVCSICKDTGIVHPRREDGTADYSEVVTCQCSIEAVERKRLERLSRYCQLPAKTENKTFETFEARDKETLEAIALSKSIARGDGGIIFLTLLSDTGRGKSHLAIAICREWLSRGQPAMYVYVPELMDDLRSSYKKDESSGEAYSQLLDRVCEVPLLVLDDLGTEKKSDWVCEKLQTIIDHRSRSALPLVVTTNKHLDKLPNDDEGRISSRLQREDWCKVVVF